LSLLKDTRNLPYTWFWQNYASKVSKKMISFQAEFKANNLADYATFGNMMTYFDNTASSPFSKSVLATMTPNSALVGWGNSELDLVATSSEHAVMVHAADWAINLSTLSNYDVPEQHQRGHSTAVVQQNTHTVTFLMTDGDNIQWMLNDFATSTNWFNSPDRGKVNLGWTMSPALSELAPVVMDYLYQKASNTSRGRDYFVGAPSGLGYMYPDVYTQLPAYTKLTSQYLQKADLSVVNVIGNNADPKFLTEYIQQDNIDAIFYYLYSDYSGLAGKIYWLNGKPVIGGRYNLWQQYNTPETLAAKLNALSRNIHSTDAYSLIPVHVWTMTVSDVLKCQSLLSPGVKVVTPEEFVQLLVKNVPH